MGNHPPPKKKQGGLYLNGGACGVIHKDIGKVIGEPSSNSGGSILCSPCTKALEKRIDPSFFSLADMNYISKPTGLSVNHAPFTYINK